MATLFTAELLNRTKLEGNGKNTLFIFLFPFTYFAFRPVPAQIPVPPPPRFFRATRLGRPQGRRSTTGDRPS